MATKTYRALVELRYPTNPKAKRENWEWRRVAPGETVDDIPAQSVGWLLEQNRIEPVGAEDGDA